MLHNTIFLCYNKLGDNMEEGMSNNNIDMNYINMNNNDNGKGNNTGIIIIVVIFAILIAIGILSYYLYIQFMNRVDFGSKETNQTNTTKVIPASNDINKWYEDTLKDTIVTVIGTTWCPHCQEYKPVITRLSNEKGFKLYFFEIDTLTEEQVNTVTKTFNLENYTGAVPYTFIVKNGKFISDTVGFSSEEETIEYLDSALNANDKYTVSVKGNIFAFTSIEPKFFEKNSICELHEFENICYKYNNAVKNKYFEDDESTQMSYLIIDSKDNIVKEEDINENIEYKLVDEFDYYTSNLDKIFEKDNYVVYRDNKNKLKIDKEDPDKTYLVIDTYEKAKFEVFKANNSNNIYEFLVDCSVLGIIDVKNELLNDEYREYSCNFHSDIQLDICDSDVTIIGKMFGVADSDNAAEKFGLFSLRTFKTIIEPKYDNIIKNGEYYIVINKGKHGIIDKTGKEIVKLEYDYIGWDSYLGYLFIKGNEIELYNEKLEKIDLSEKTIKDYYEQALQNTNNNLKKGESKVESLFLKTAESWYWSAGSELGIFNINKPFDYDEDEESFSFKYEGIKYSGDKLILKSKCTDTFMYVIEDNKAYKIDEKDIKEGSDDTSCF